MECNRIITEMPTNETATLRFKNLNKKSIRCSFCSICWFWVYFRRDEPENFG